MLVVSVARFVPFGKLHWSLTVLLIVWLFCDVLRNKYTIQWCYCRHRW